MDVGFLIFGIILALILELSQKVDNHVPASKLPYDLIWKTKIKINQIIEL